MLLKIMKHLPSTSLNGPMRSIAKLFSQKNLLRNARILHRPTASALDQTQQIVLRKEKPAAAEGPPRERKDLGRHYFVRLHQSSTSCFALSFA